MSRKDQLEQIEAMRRQIEADAKRREQVRAEAAERIAEAKRRGRL